MENEIRIIPPDGYELDKENSTTERIIFKLKKNKLPVKWEDLYDISGYYIDNNSMIIPVYKVATCTNNNRNIFTTIELAESILHFAEYSQLLKQYENNLNDFIPIHFEYESKLKPIFDLLYGANNIKEYYYLSLLIKLYNLYVGNYKPDFNNSDVPKYCINYTHYKDNLLITALYNTYKTFTFPTKIMGEDFIAKYKDILELIKSII